MVLSTLYPKYSGAKAPHIHNIKYKYIKPVLRDLISKCKMSLMSLYSLLF